MDFTNEHRFDNISDVYDNVRPRTPRFPAETAVRYLNRRPAVVVDMGCGSGLSSVLWTEYCDNVVGIEPNEEMIKLAGRRAGDRLHFVKAFSHETGLAEKSVDIVTCSQSFHWMEPKSTLCEVNRILSPGGVFMVIDYDWPPVSDWRVEKSFDDMYALAKELEKRAPASPEAGRRWDKNKHTSVIRESGYFRYVREIYFESSESCDADRLYSMALSQSRIKFASKLEPEVFDPKLQEYRRVIDEVFGEKSFEVTFCYRMTAAVK